MYPSNLLPNSLVQQQSAQQSQQPSDHPMVPGIHNAEQSRMWQQLKQYHRSQGGGDMNQSQVNQQMAEFARNQMLSRPDQFPHQFNMNAARMGANPPFNDGQGNSNNPMMPSFSMGNNSMPSDINTRNAMMQALQHNQQNNVNRQMQQLMGGQNHQVSPSPNPVDLARMASQQHAQMGNAQPGSSQAMNPHMFSSPNMHSSPHPTAARPTAQVNTPHVGMTGQQPMPKPGLQDMNDRRLFLQQNIATVEGSLRALMHQRGQIPDNTFNSKLQQLQTDLKQKKELLHRFTQFVMSSQQTAANGSHPGANNMMNGSSQQSSVQSGQMPNGQSPQGWMSQNMLQNSNMGMNMMSNQQQQSGQQQMAHGMNGVNQQGNQILRQNAMAQRSVQPQQQVPGNMGNVVSNGNVQMPTPSIPTMAAGMDSIQVPPLDPMKFEMMYRQFCANQKQEFKLTVPVSDRSVELHQLHRQVMTANGLGNFPGNDRQPPRCGPMIAQQLRHIYQETLHSFDQTYSLSWRNRLRNLNNGAGSSGNAPYTPPQQPNIPAVNDNQANANRIPDNRQLAMLALRFGASTAEDMRAQGVPPHIINFVETKRPLMTFIRQQHERRMAQGSANGGLVPPRNMANGPTGAPMSTQAGPSAPARPPMNNGVQPGPVSLHDAQGMAAIQPPSMAGKIAATPAQSMGKAMQFITMMKNALAPNLANMNSVGVPDEQRLEYGQVLETVYKLCLDLEHKLAMFSVLVPNHQTIKKLVAIVLTVQRQRAELSKSSPKYIVNLQTLRDMHGQVTEALNKFQEEARKSSESAALRGMPQPGPSQLLTQSQPGPSTQPMPPTIPPGPPQMVTPPVNRTPSMNNAHLPQHKNQQLSISASPSLRNAPISHPTPPSTTASTAATPAAQAPTPQAGPSPQTPKSPKGKAASKPAPKRIRRPSKAALPQVAEHSTASASLKRVREEDSHANESSGTAPSSSAQPSSAPSPKKLKTEWEGPPDDALLKRKQDIENVNSEEDASAFLEKMSELIRLTAGSDPGINNDIAQTLDQILRGVGQDPSDNAISGSALQSRPIDNMGEPMSPSQVAANEEYLEFLDLSSFATGEEEDSASKPPTPELVSSSSTNPSPESSDADPATAATSMLDKTKVEEFDASIDLFNLGPLKDIDGGESAYYQADNWKWDGSMTTIEQPWAIFTST
ncbi:hypothetical protein CONPUDRAFT_151169 [Coniophora puteana RWD-64-598 SS2]|uniref:ARID domain-containing protein n=1 Tax=Coniophora puteana (strain RWD-64-598) TaxID=741705 RepID=A0A5M3MYM4_CONPW|nr:uncharacterized protein CONPUDRAFT_151169 [Coniophora puteana RWD-64-598 SS2]EIW84127.1 hypothetical protein CONPUDRAFT_151169 [Coniophora puteana RWD-64-598 SS2]